MERTTLTLVQSLPGISRWFEVDKRELVRNYNAPTTRLYPDDQLKLNITQTLMLRLAM